jgi:lipooligosaccharide transport system permease protein
MRVYTKNFITNAFPPFLDPFIFLAGIGIGLGVSIGTMDGVPYVQFLATGLLVSTAMFTSAFECSYGTFIRLEFDKVYDGMIAAPLTAENIFLGEILWAGVKGFLFSLAVLIIIKLFGFVPSLTSFLTPFVGLLTGLMFASIAMFITSLVNSIDQFNFFFTGFLSPMFFFSGVVFSISSLPGFFRIIAEIVPLTHTVRLARAICFNRYDISLLFDILYIIAFILIFGYLGISRLKKKIVD